ASHAGSPQRGGTGGGGGGGGSGRTLAPGGRRRGTAGPGGNGGGSGMAAAGVPPALPVCLGAPARLNGTKRNGPPILPAAPARSHEEASKGSLALYSTRSVQFPPAICRERKEILAPPYFDRNPYG